MNAEREDNLWPLLPSILNCHPEINDIWLYLGRGPMLKGDDTPPELSAKNTAGDYTGELLGTALGFMGLDDEKAARKLGWDVSELQLLLESRVLPTFSQLERLYTKLGIDPSYFFDGNEHWMHVPKDAVLRILWALGRSPRDASGIILSDVFDIPLDEAKDFYKEWQEFRKKGRNRSVPGPWLDHLQENYAFNPHWLMNFEPPMATPREQCHALSPDQTRPTPQEVEILELLRENRQLRIEMEALRKKVEGEKFEKIPVLGTISAAPSSHQETDRN
ncbi:hypothetical protein LJC47_03065 [Desulfosarcina sp. OttesenSCG-928-B08]|nr:hypothetical protein [Desulfosarcina sp. OttesenSCG-928-B08]